MTWTAADAYPAGFDSRTDLWIAALAAPDQHRSVLLEVGTGPGGSLYCRWSAGGGWTLNDYLSLAAPLSLAQAVTVLAPIAQTLHRLGQVHGAVSVDTVMITPVGAPVLTGFNPPGAQKAVGGSDLAGFEEVFRRVAENVGRSSGSFAAIASRLIRTDPPHRAREGTSIMSGG